MHEGVTLPNTISELMAMGVSDMQGLDQTKFRPNPLTWHSVPRHEDDKRCVVSLAGAVMVVRFDIGPEEDVRSLMIFDESTRCKFKALHSAEMGLVADALNYLDEANGVEVKNDDGRLRARKYQSLNAEQRGVCQRYQHGVLQEEYWDWESFQDYALSADTFVEELRAVAL